MAVSRLQSDHSLRLGATAVYEQGPLRVAATAFLTVRGFPGGLALLLEGAPGLPLSFGKSILAASLHVSISCRELNGEHERGDETVCDNSKQHFLQHGF